MLRAMRVVLSSDMEGISQLRRAREILAACPEYWHTGRPRYEAEVAAACEGLLAGGATEVIVLDNHASGNPANLAADALPSGARLESWNLWDVPRHDVDAMLQVGYHARGGVDGFLSHTYLPGLRLRVDGELISESHGRAWASGLPLLGITGNDLHLDTLGSLAETPFLVVQRTISRGEAEPLFDPVDAANAIRAFAEQCMRDAASAPAVTVPSQLTFEASMPNGNLVVDQMTAAGWEQAGEVEFVARLQMWDDARELLAAAMNAALAPFVPYWLGGFDSAEDAAAADQQRVEQLRLIFDAWAEESHPQWYTQPADPMPFGVAEQLTRLS